MEQLILENIFVRSRNLILRDSEQERKLHKWSNREKWIVRIALKSLQLRSHP